MTKTIFQNWKVMAGLSIAAVLLGGAFSFGLFTPKAEAGEMNGNGFDGFSTPTSCLAAEVNHWDKIIFSSKKDILNKDGVVIFDKKEIFDIKELDDPTTIERPLQKAADKFNSVGWTTEKGESFNPNDLKLIDIEYAIVCVASFADPPGGNNNPQ